MCLLLNVYISLTLIHGPHAFLFILDLGKNLYISIYKYSDVYSLSNMYLFSLLKIQSNYIKLNKGRIDLMALFLFLFC